MSAMDAKTTLIDCIRTLRNQHDRILVRAGEATRYLDTDELEKMRKAVEDRLLYADDAASANRIYLNGVLEMWKLAAINIVDRARPSRLIFYRFLFMDHWLLDAPCSRSHKRFLLRLGNLQDQHLAFTHEEVLNGYADVVEDTAGLLVSLQSNRRKVIGGIVTVCSMSGITAAVLAVWLIKTIGS